MKQDLLKKIGKWLMKLDKNFMLSDIDTITVTATNKDGVQVSTTISADMASTRCDSVLYQTLSHVVGSMANDCLVELLRFIDHPIVQRVKEKKLSTKDIEPHWYAETDTGYKVKTGQDEYFFFKDKEEYEIIRKICDTIVIDRTGRTELTENKLTLQNKNT